MHITSLNTNGGHGRKLLAKIPQSLIATCLFFMAVTTVASAAVKQAATDSTPKDSQPNLSQAAKPPTIQQASPPLSAAEQLERALSLLNQGKIQETIPLLMNAARTNGDAAFYLGRLLELGLLQGTPDIETAVEMYKKGVELGSKLAMDRLGLMYLSGTGVIRDYMEGAKLVCKAAESGNPTALFNCGIALLEGRGIDKDPKKAFEYLKQAEAKGHLGAGNLLAELYISGQAGKTDKKKAFELSRKVAQLGNPTALFRLGQMYATGIGTKKDLVKAYMYFNLAAARQHQTAAQALQALEQRMSQKDVLKAQALSRKWQPKSTASIPLSKQLAMY